MYMVVNWEMVNSIYRRYICVFLPNHGSTTFLMMYIDVLWWMIIRDFNSKTCRTLAHLLSLAGRLSHTRLHPPNQSAHAIANGAPKQHERRSIPAHARFGKPRLADAEKLGRLLRRKQPLKFGIGLAGERPTTV